MEIESSEAWIAYVELRKKKNARAPFTEVARARILAKLRAFEAQGQDIEAMLYQSIENGWTGVFPVKAQPGISTASVTVQKIGPDPALAKLDADLKALREWRTTTKFDVRALRARTLERMAAQKVKV